MNIDWKKWMPHIVAVGIFLALTLSYMSPVLEGKKLKQGDITQYTGMAKEIKDFRADYGEEPLWTGSAFSGMPSFTISTMYKTDIFRAIHTFIGDIFPTPVRLLFTLFIGFYILLISFRVNPWLSIVGAIGFALSSNFIISIEAGHNTKVLSIAYMPAIVGGLILLFQHKKYFIGGIVTALFAGLQIFAGHFQINYYTGLVAGLIVVVYLIIAIQRKEYKPYFLALGISIAAAVFAIWPNFSKLYSVYDHSKESMRGGQSELSAKKDEMGGLSWDYALSQWSFGVEETWTLIFPNAMGGSTVEFLDQESNTYETMNNFLQQNFGQNLNRPEIPVPTYYGPQSVTAPIYFGVTVFFLFFFGIFFVRGKNKWWIIAAFVMSLFIAWGSHFEFFNKFLFNYFPLFNKFRNPAMALSVAGMATPLLGILAIRKLVDFNISREETMKYFKYGIMLTAGVFALAAIYGISSDFEGPDGDAAAVNRMNQYLIDPMFGDAANNPEVAPRIDQLREAVHTAIVQDRKDLYWGSVGRSLIFVALIAGLVFLFLRGKVNKKLLLAGLAVLILVDLWMISRNYLNEESFATPSNYMAELEMTAADRAILQDPDPHYRVLNYANGLFSDGYTPYYHKSILGYSAAKVQLYQDMIEYQLGQQIRVLPQLLQQAQNQNQMERMFEQVPAINMLNTKYIMFGETQNDILVNPNALGAAWFVEDIMWVEDADAEMQALSTFDPGQTAIVQERFKGQLPQEDYTVPPGASIEITDYKTNHLTYFSQNSNPGLAVFSEVYYKKGWNAYIDGEKAPIIKVNYALRGVHIPAGEHEIEMVFEPKSYEIGETVSLAGSIVFLLLVAGSLYWKFGRHRKSRKSSKRNKK